MACGCGDNNGKKDVGLIRQIKPITSIVSFEADSEEKKELEKKEPIKETLPKRIIKFM